MGNFLSDQYTIFGSSDDAEEWNEIATGEEIYILYVYADNNGSWVLVNTIQPSGNEAPSPSDSVRYLTTINGGKCGTYKLIVGGNGDADFSFTIYSVCTGNLVATANSDYNPLIVTF